MTIIWFALGGFAGLLFLVFVIGMFMPERYVGLAQVTYDKSADDVWTALLDYDRNPMTGKMKKSVQTQSIENDLPVWTEEMRSREVITVKTIEADRPQHMVREMTSISVPMTSRWTYTLEPLGEGCKLTMDGETTIRSGTWHVPIFRVMMKLGGGVKKGLDIQMNMVAESLGVEAKRG